MVRSDTAVGTPDYISPEVLQHNSRFPKQNMARVEFNRRRHTADLSELWLGLEL